MKPERERGAVVEGVVVVVARGDRLLVIKRAAGIRAPGAWCFVGGAIEPGETQADAVVREFAEEVGGRVRAVAPIWQYDHPTEALRLYWWRAELLDDELLPNADEVAELRWCTPTEIAALPGLLESNQAFLRAGAIR